MANSPVAGLYDTMIDRDSAFEVLAKKAQAKQDAEAAQQRQDDLAKAAKAQPAERTYQDNQPPVRRASTRQTPGEAAMNSLARTVATTLGAALVRGILGSLKRGR
jgi:hypothetical protein